jgi:hypothetical protein
MGATWIKTNTHIPILIPPFEYHDVKGVIPTIHGMKIDEKERYNTLKDIIEKNFHISPINNSVWERKRDNHLKQIKQLIESTNVSIIASQNSSHNSIDDYYLHSDDLIKKRSKIEWPNDFEMQLHYINKQKEAVENLKQHNPLDIDKQQFEKIRKNARAEWKNDYEMQLDFEQRQVESLRRINEL